MWKKNVSVKKNRVTERNGENTKNFGVERKIKRRVGL